MNQSKMSRESKKSRILSRLFLIFILAISLLAPSIPQVQADGELWLEGWDYRKSHTITGSSVGAQTDYQIGAKVYYGSGTDGTEIVNGVTFGKVYLDSKCQTDFDDINFTKSDGISSLDYWMRAKVDSNYAIFWVEIDSIPEDPDKVDIYIYYGNEGASTSSNGTNTFLDFDDFSYGDSPTNHGWTEFEGVDTYSYEISGGRLKMSADYGDRIGLYNDISSSDGAMEVDIEIESELYPEFFSGSAIGIRKGTDYYQTTMGSEHGDGRLRYSSDWSTVYTLSFASTIDVVYALSQRYVGTALSTVIDGIVEGSGVDGNLNSGYCYLYVHSGVVYYDDFRIRKFVDPEPMPTSWGSEEEPVILCAPEFFNASSIEVIVGTLDDGNLASTYFVDGDWYNVSEVTGPPGIDIRVNFTDVEKGCGCFEFFQTFIGHPHHDIEVQIWNFTSTSWTTIGPIFFNETANWACIGLGHYYTDYFRGGNLYARFYHEGVGHVGHEFHIDRIDLSTIQADFYPPAIEVLVDYSIIFLAIGIILMLAIAFLYVKRK